MLYYFFVGHYVSEKRRKQAFFDIKNNETNYTASNKKIEI